MKSNKADLIEKWLKEGTDDAKNIIDLPWNVQREEDKENDAIVLVAKHLRFPMPIVFRIDDYNTTVMLEIDYATDSMDPKQRMEIYRNLLKINTELPYIKVGLIGDDLYVILVGEIETKIVDHDVLNNYMEIVVNGLYKVASSLGLEEDLIQLTMENIVSFVDEKRKSGMKKEEIENYLAKKLGMPKNEVSSIIDKIYKETAKMDNPGNSYF